MRLLKTLQDRFLSEKKLNAINNKGFHIGYLFKFIWIFIQYLLDVFNCAWSLTLTTSNGVAKEIKEENIIKYQKYFCTVLVFFKWIIFKKL